jgi:hypothetical protein
MSAPVDGREARTGDRVVAIAGFVALLVVGFFGDEPKPAPKPVPVASAAPSVQR